MSLDASRWAWEQRVGSSGAKLVLLALADRAGADDTSFPSIPLICKDTELDRKTAIKAIASLIGQRLIADTGERRGRTRNVKVYRLIGVDHRHNNTENGTVPNSEQFQISHETVPKRGPLNGAGSGTENLSIRTDQGTTRERQFDRFWQLYPKKRSKGQAERAWAKLKPSEQLMQQIESALRRAKTSEDWTRDGGKYIPYPATWLNAKGWEDDYSDGAAADPSLGAL